MDFHLVELALGLFMAYIWLRLSASSGPAPAPVQPYQYRPLSSPRSIRVFTLLPSWKKGGVIEGTLSEVTLDTDPVFEALSYVWGDASRMQEIRIYGDASQEGGRAGSLVVTPNCIEVLHAMRSRWKARVLWIDAICIDQNSTSEKNQQVPLMSELYDRARSVLVWLRPDDHQNASAIRQTVWMFRLIGLLYRLRLLRLYETDEQTAFRQPRNTWLVAALDNLVQSRCQKLGNAFNAPFMNSYFQRVWTVQEVAKAHAINVHYGAHQFYWRDIVAAGLFTVKKGGFARNQEEEIYLSRDYERHWTLLNSLESHFVLPDIYGAEAISDYSKQLNVLDKFSAGVAELALLRSRGLKAGMAQDKAYAMLWAFSEGSSGAQSLLEVDYKKPIDVIYTEFSTAIFVKMKGSTYQLYSVNSQPRKASLPSWVPDWEINVPMSMYIWAEKLREHRAAMEQSYEYRLDIRGARLKMSGIEYSTLMATIRLSEEARQRPFDEFLSSNVVESLTDMSELFRGVIETMNSHNGLSKPEVLQALHRTIHSDVEQSLTGELDRAIYLATPTEARLADAAGISVGLLRIQAFDRLSFLLDEDKLQLEKMHAQLSSILNNAEAEEVIQRLSDEHGLSPFLSLLVAMEPCINIYRLLYTAISNHKDKDFFITAKGDLGMAYQGLQGRDIICLLQGCPSPMVLRKTSLEGQEFHLLHGPAFVNGIMDGEAWPQDTSTLHEYTFI